MIIHIGKCGGSNLKEKFLKLHNFDITTRIGKIHNGKQHLKRLENIKNNDHIALLIRDPVKRFISIFYYYKDKIDGKWELKEKQGRKNLIKIYKRFKTPNELAEALSSENLNDKILALKSFVHFNHLKYNFEYFLPEHRTKEIADKKVFVIRTEHYKEDFKIYYEFLIKKFNLPDKFDKFFINIRHNTNKHNNKKI